jgi:hypothetical protein
MARADDEADARKAAEAKLAAMMERKFLDMFGEDDDAGKGASARKKKKAKPKGGRAVEAARKETARQEETARKDAEDAKKKGKKRGRKDDSDSEDGLPSFSGRHRVASSAAAAASAPASTPNDGGVQVVTFTWGQAQRVRVQERRHRVRQPPRRIPRQETLHERQGGQGAHGRRRTNAKTPKKNDTAEPTPRTAKSSAWWRA